MGKKLMEITDFKKKLKTSRATLTLLDTSFTQLTRKITSDPGASYLTAAAGDPLSKELIVSLNEAQIALKERYEILFSEYNAWITEKQTDIPDLETFDYEFSAIYDYSSGYEADSTSADYYMLTSIVNAEKELYEAGNYWFMNNLESNLEVIKEWSKSQYYLSNMSYIEGFFETGYSRSWTYSKSHGITVSFNVSGSDKVTIKASNLGVIPDGETCTIKVTASYTTESGSGENNYEHYEYGYLYIKRTEIEGDSFIKTWAAKDGLDDHAYVKSVPLSGDSAAHFDTDTPSFSWLQERIYS
jgi:hypothetical protein